MVIGKSNTLTPPTPLSPRERGEKEREKERAVFEGRVFPFESNKWLDMDQK